MKKKIVAVILAIFVGGLGVHKFYLRQPELGIGYIALFIWLGRFFGFPISTFLGWYDAYKLMTIDESEFDRRYNSYYYKDRYGRRLDKVKEKQHRKEGRYILLDSEANEMKNDKQGYLKPHNRMNEVQVFKKEGIKNFKEYNTKGAIDNFKKGLEILPQDKSLHFNIACAYSLEEKAFEAFYHLDRAFAFGFNERDKIISHEALAYIRVLPEFDMFQKNEYRISEQWLNNLKNRKADHEFILKQEVPIPLHNENR